MKVNIFKAQLALFHLQFISIILYHKHLAYLRYSLSLISNWWLWNEEAKILRKCKLYFIFLRYLSRSIYYISIVVFFISVLIETWTEASFNIRSLPGSSALGILQTRMLEWVAFSSSRGSSQPRDRTHVSCIYCIGRQVLDH